MFERGRRRRPGSGGCVLDFVLRAVQFRKRRLALAFAALAVSATLATALFSVYSDIERKMRVQFRGFGANIVIAPAGGEQTVPLAAVALAERQGAVAAPFIYTVGAWMANPWWWPAQTSAAPVR
jgi:hypothetical protein